MYKLISSFKEIDVKEKTLIILDIDDTIMGYKEFNHTYFMNKLDYYTQEHKNEEIAIKKAVKDWITMVENSTPFHMDYDGYKYLLDKINETQSHHIFITTRNLEHKQLTESHLYQIGVVSEHIYYSNGTNKGELLQQILHKYTNYDNIVFIDDLDKNLDDMKRSLGDKVELYQFIKKLMI